MITNEKVNREYKRKSYMGGHRGIGTVSILPYFVKTKTRSTWKHIDDGTRVALKGGQHLCHLKSQQL